MSNAQSPMKHACSPRYIHITFLQETHSEGTCKIATCILLKYTVYCMLALLKCTSNNSFDLSEEQEIARGISF